MENQIVKRQLGFLFKFNIEVRQYSISAVVRAAEWMHDDFAEEKFGLYFWYRCQTETYEIFTTASSAADPILLLSQDKFHPEILTGSPRAGAPNKRGVGI